MSASLADFIAARLDEDHRAAYAVMTACRDSRQPWPPEQAPGRGGPVLTDYLKHFSESRVLREVTAKRAILALHKPDRNPDDQWYGHDVRCEECGGIGGSPAIGERGFQRSWPCRTLRALAAIWSDHEAYQQDWAPETVST